jgi:hypothetical protein
MKATEVRILRALDPGESYIEPVFVLVETDFDESGEPVTTIDHVSSAIVEAREGWSVRTLGQSVPMTHAAAREWAVSYAASRGIPLVYERDTTGDGDGYAAALNVGAPAPGAGAASPSSLSK